MFGRERTECGVEILGLSCEIDVRYVPILRAALRRKIEARCKALILDLSEVYDIDASAVAAFIEYYRESGEHGGVLCLCGVNEGLKPVFDTVEMGNSLLMVETVADAVAAVTRGEVQPYREVVNDAIDTDKNDNTMAQLSDEATSARSISQTSSAKSGC